MNIDELFSFYDDFGYLGILLISFVGSIIVFVPIPYFPVLITAAFNNNLDPVLISLSSAIGAVIAKLIIFYASYYGRNILSPKIKGKMVPLQRLLGRYGAMGAFVAAVSPIPDDIVYIPLGLTKYSPWKFGIATFLGKFVLNLSIVLGVYLFWKTLCKQSYVEFNKYRFSYWSNHCKYCSIGNNSLFYTKDRLGKNYRTLVSMDVG